MGTFWCKIRHTLMTSIFVPAHPLPFYNLRTCSVHLVWAQTCFLRRGLYICAHLLCTYLMNNSKPGQLTTSTRKQPTDSKTVLRMRRLGRSWGWFATVCDPCCDMSQSERNNWSILRLRVSVDGNRWPTESVVLWTYLETSYLTKCWNQWLNWMSISILSL